MTEKVKVFLLAASLGVAMFALSGCSEADWQAIGQTLDEVAAQGREIRLQREAEERERQRQREAEEKQARRQYEVKINELTKNVTQAIRPTHPTVRTYALRLARQYPGPRNPLQVKRIWYHVKRNWRYVSDPRGGDYFAPANETIEAGLAGDCDDFAILLASLIEAIGGDARIVLAFGPGSGHAYCELWMGMGVRDGPAIRGGPYYREYGEYYDTLEKKDVDMYWHKGPGQDNCWLNLDWGADYPGGAFFEATRQIFIYADGTWE